MALEPLNVRVDVGGGKTMVADRCRRHSGLAATRGCVVPVSRVAVCESSGPRGDETPNYRKALSWCALLQQLATRG